MGNLLFEAVKKALIELAEQRIGGQIGITATLHTWGQNLALHPHIHCIIPGGALMPNGTWLAQPKIIAHIKELATGVAASATVSVSAEVKPESEVATNEECSCKRCELCGGKMLLDNSTFKLPLIIFSKLASEALAREPRTKEKVSADAEGKSTEDYAAV
jgi:hypothetical protein